MVSLTPTPRPQAALPPAPAPDPEPIQAEAIIPPDAPDAPPKDIASRIVDELDPRLTPKQRAYLIAFSATGAHRRAVAASGVGRSTMGRWMQSDEVFRAGMLVAERAVFQRLHDEAVTRALAGPADPGSTTLLCRLLSVYGDGRFRPTQKVEHSGQVEYRMRIILGADEHGDQVLPSF